MSIHSSVTISLVPEASGGPFVFWDGLENGCRQAREIGFDAVEIFPDSPDSLAVDVVRPSLDRHGLRIAAVGTGAGWVKHKLQLCHHEPGERRRAIDFITSIIDAAGRFGAPTIIGSMQGRSANGVDRQIAWNWLGEALDELGEHALRYGVPLLFEPLNRYETNLVNTIQDGVRLLKLLKTANIRLLADLFHENIEEADLPAGIRAGEGYIGHVHWADSNRRPAGFGHTNFTPIAAALREIHYSGHISAEVFPYPDPQAAAEHTMQSFRNHFPRH